MHKNTKNKINEHDEKFLNKFVEEDGGWGYGDPDARLNDDRRINIILARQQIKTQEQQVKAQKQLNILTFMLVIVSILNILVLFHKI